MRPPVHIPETGHDDGGSFQEVDGFGFLDGPDELEPWEIERLRARSEKGLGFLVEALGMSFENIGYVDGHGAVQENEQPWDSLLMNQPIEMEHEFLGPFDGERGNDAVSTRIHRVENRLAEELLDILGVFVIPVAVGRLHEGRNRHG